MHTHVYTPYFDRKQNFGMQFIHVKGSRDSREKQIATEHDVHIAAQRKINVTILRPEKNLHVTILRPEKNSHAIILWPGKNKGKHTFWL